MWPVLIAARQELQALHVAAQHVLQHAAAVQHTLLLTSMPQHHDSSSHSATSLQGSITTSAQQQQQQQLAQGFAQPQAQTTKGPLPLLLGHRQQLWPVQQHHLLQQQRQRQQQQQRQQHEQYLCKQHQHHHQQNGQQLRCYHRATHAARTLTTKLLQQDSWQGLHMLFDAAGGGSRLAPIQLCALLQRLAKLAPAPELLTAAERSQLRGFADELTAACIQKLHRLDAVGLSVLVSSTLKLGCNLQSHPQQQQQQQQQQQDVDASAADSGSQQMQEQASVYVQLLKSAAKQVAYAHGHAAGMLLAAMTALHQQQLQQQQQQQGLPSVHMQLQLWTNFTAALQQRLRACTAVQQLPSQDASKLCSTVSRLSGLLARQRAAAVAAAAAGAAADKSWQHAAVLSGQQSMLEGLEGHDAADAAFDGALSDADADVVDSVVAAAHTGGQPMHSSTAPGSSTSELQQLQVQYSQLQRQLRGLLSLAAQQVEAAASQGTLAAAPAASLASTSRVLHAIAKTRAWPGWPAVQGLLQQYSTALQAVQLSAAPAAFEQQQGVGRLKQKKQSKPKLGLMDLPGFVNPAVGHSVNPGGAAGAAEGSAQALGAITESVGPAVWAVGLLVEQRQQQQQRQRNPPQQLPSSELRSELLQHIQAWKALRPVLLACQHQLQLLGTAQLAQLVTGLGKLVHSSRSLVQQATAPTAAATAVPASVNDGVTGTTYPQHAADRPSKSATGEAPSNKLGGLRLDDADAGIDEMAHVLSGLLDAPELQRLLRQHVARIESMLPLLVLQHRLRVAAAYRQLGLQLPRSVASVFDRDAAAGQ